MRMKKDAGTVIRWFVAEFIGTMFLAALVGVLVLAHLGYIDGYVSVYLPAAIGTLVAMMVYLIGPVSGANLNPAVTVGLFAFRKITSSQFLTNLIAQFLGAWTGSLLVMELVGVSPNIPTEPNRALAMGEFFGAFLLVFAVMSVVIGRVKEEVGGIVIGAALAVGIGLSMVTGGGILNPAIATAFGASQLTYLLVPLLGGVAGAAVAILLDDRN
jgi:glycerol uptake facilitator-like aquaporin